MSHSTTVWSSLGGQLLMGLAFISTITAGTYIGRKFRSSSGRFLAGYLILFGLIPLGSFLSHGFDHLSHGFDHGSVPLILKVISVLGSPIALAVGVLGGSFFWLAFVLSYTSGLAGREKRLLGLGAPTAVIVVLFAQIPIEAHDAGLGLVGNQSTAVMINNLGGFLFLLLGYGTVGYGAVKLIRIARTHTMTTFWGSILLIIAPAGLFASIVVSNVIFDPPAGQPHGFGVLFSAIVISIAVLQQNVLDDIPALQLVGRDSAVETIESGILVLNPDGIIIDANTAAENLYSSFNDSPVGRPLEDVLPDGVDSSSIATPGHSVFEIPSKNAVIRSHTTAAEDESGRELGRTIVFHDITGERRRQQRIQVLNRVLRHNLRNDLNAVNGYAELLEEEVTDTKDYAIQIQEMAAELISIGEKAREIEEVVSAQQQSRKATLGEAIEQAVDEVREAEADCQISVSLGVAEEQVNGTVLTSVVRELVENACRHNDADDPRVEVETATTDGDYSISIRVADNGPGIPEHELTPLQEGTETALEHGSGLGLWLIDWGVATLGGEIEFEASESRGTVATLRLPLDR